MVNERKWFNILSTEELFTEYIYSLMRKRKNFIVFLDNQQILVEKEANEWINTHDLNDETERIIYKYVYMKGYVIHYSNHCMDILVSLDLLKNKYSDFIREANNR